METLQLKSERADFICQRCGQCCKECGPNMWIGGSLTWQEKQDLLKERKKYPVNKEGCAMLYFDKKLAHCLVLEVLGVDKREANCNLYPKDELCARETKELNERIKVLEK